MAHRIRTLFLSAQQPIISALMSFFCNDPLILPTFDDYSNFAELVNFKCKKHSVIVFDDGSLTQNEHVICKLYI